MKTTDTSHVSPTAHLTSCVWFRNGLSHEALVTPYGWRLYRTLHPFDALYRRLSGKAGLESTLMARHLFIDKLLMEAIEEGRIGQVVEVAAGLSPRGFRFTRRYPNVVYIEGDLPHMVDTKLQLLNRGGLRGVHHHVVELNALVDEGAMSIGGVIRSLLDSNKGTAIITEGLLGYFDLEELEAMWRRFSLALGTMSGGLYLADIFLNDERMGLATRLFKRVFSRLVRAKTYLHYASTAECAGHLRDSGFSSAILHEAAEGHLVRVLESKVVMC